MAECSVESANQFTAERMLRWWILHNVESFPVLSNVLYVHASTFAYRDSANYAMPLLVIKYYKEVKGSVVLVKA